MRYIFCSNMTCDQFVPSRAPARQWTTCAPKGGSCGKRFPDAAWGTRERPRFVDILAQPRPAALLPAPDRLRPLTQFPSPPAWWLAAPRVAVLPDPGVRWACRRGWGGALPGARGGLPRSALICVRRPRPRAWSSGGGARPARSATGRCVGRSDRCARSLPPAGLWFREARCSRGYPVTPFSSHRRCEAVNFKPGASTGASRLAQTVGNAFPLSSWGKN